MTNSELLSLCITNGAENNCITPPVGVKTGGLDVGNLIVANSLTIMFVIAAIALVFFTVWGGIQWITSGGDKAKIQAARNRITYAIIGLIVTFLSFFIVNTVGGAFGINFFGKNS